ncbi:MAG: heparinase II/III family protein [Chitinophagaceae bacterium]|nr:heparinase II/III family protein [Chitinophagaceae bacterium]
MHKLLQAYHIARNMGPRYILFRLNHELQKRTGRFMKRFPVQPPWQEYLSLEDWKANKPAFFLTQKPGKSFADLGIPALPEPPCINGSIRFFNAAYKQLGKDYDWLTHPLTGYRYNPGQHWSRVNDFSAAAGDIKYVWEKSRFSYIYEVIRYDQQQGTSHAAWVLAEICSWIDANPVNAGPNYKCSQEMSLRLLNWTFALNYYQHDKALTPEVFYKIQYAMYWQARHVFDNIHFSRIAVRNNHAITETLALYIMGSLFPQFPGASEWKEKGRRWFEQEIAYQVYPDGTFLQFSMNYHRVVVQLFCWAFAVSEALQESFGSVVYERAYASLRFLAACQDSITGWLPNYGNNDGALFFPLSSCDYRDFRPQLNTLHLFLTGQALYERGAWSEDAWWFRAGAMQAASFAPIQPQDGWQVFHNGGYAVLREGNTLSFLRCGSHKDRPAQADNLHLDVWHNGQNVLQDGGSYQYNALPEEMNYFMGTASHNTVMLGAHNQMLKGSRFIWFYWTQAEQLEVEERPDAWVFRGTIRAFGQLGRNIRHRRTVTKKKGVPHWEVEDMVLGKPGHLPLRQLWHPATAALRLEAQDAHGQKVAPSAEPGWVSAYYGIKEESDTVVFSVTGQALKTTIEL